MAKATRDNGTQIEVLRAIWSELKEVRTSFGTQLEATRRSFQEELGATRRELGERIDQTNQRLDAARTEIRAEIGDLRRQSVESETRLATATAELAGDVRTLTGLIRDWRDEHRADREELRARVTRLEDHVGIGSGH